MPTHSPDAGNQVGSIVFIDQKGCSVHSGRINKCSIYYEWLKLTEYKIHNFDWDQH